MAHDVNQSEKDVAAQVRSALVERISSERYDLWIPESTQWTIRTGNSTQSGAGDDSSTSSTEPAFTLALTFESDFHCQLARRMLQDDLISVAQPILGADVRVAFSVDNSLQQVESAPATAPASREPSSAIASTTRPTSAAVSIAIDSATNRDAAGRRVSSNAPAVDPLESKASSELSLIGGSKFVSGGSNELASATARLIIASPGKHTPVLIYGPSGSGKSMLADSIAQHLRGIRRMRRVVHMTSEQFTNDFTDGLRGGGLPMFRRKYRDVEALILEDIQFFGGKRSTLTELKHTLDNLVRGGKQVVLTADRSLNELQALGTDLVARIRGGLSTPVFPLDESTRCKILEQEAQSQGIQTSQGVFEQIASRVTGDGRVLSGIIHRLAAAASVQNKPLDWETCWDTIFDLVQATQPFVRIVDIERVVCDVFGLAPDSLQSSSKIRSVSQPRMLAMFLARKYTPAAYKEIGDYFGRRRHSTVISAEKTVNGWLHEAGEHQISRGMSVRDAIRHVESQLQVG